MSATTDPSLLAIGRFAPKSRERYWTNRLSPAQAPGREGNARSDAALQVPEPRKPIAAREDRLFFASERHARPGTHRYHLREAGARPA